MRHNLETNSRGTVTVKDYDTTTPLIGLTVATSSASSSVSLAAKEVDDLITLLQFYRARLEFTPPGG